MTQPIICASNRCLHDTFPPEPPTDVWQTSEAGEIQKEEVRTFENDSILGAPKVHKRLPDLVGYNIYRFRFISENIELVGMPKILGRVDFDIVTICFWRGREFCIKMRVLPESQTILLVL